MWFNLIFLLDHKKSHCIICNYLRGHPVWNLDIYCFHWGYVAWLSQKPSGLALGSRYMQFVFCSKYGLNVVQLSIIRSVGYLLNWDVVIRKPYWLQFMKLNSNLTPKLMEPGGSMLHWQGFSCNPYPEPNQHNSSYCYPFL